MTKFNLAWLPKRPRKSTDKLVATSPLKPVLTGFRIVLKPPCEADFDEWSLVRRKNQNHLKPFEPKWPKNCLGHDFFTRRLNRQDVEYKAGRGLYFLIHDKKTNHIIGGLNLNNIQMGAARHATLGYWIDQDYQGQGLMKEAITLLIGYAFKTLKLKRLNAACLPQNKRSINLLKSLDFEEEGFAKKYLQINGVWQDHVLFGLCNF